jgi:hypothetical protein
MIEYQAPHEPHGFDVENNRVIFLAGSIEMGIADAWQERFVEELVGYDGIIMNPRRLEWDDSWEQKWENDQFREQVRWELYWLENADQVFMYFDPNTKSSITLLELGLVTALNASKLVVCCQEPFWRKGNVDVVCRVYGVQQVDSLQALIYRAKSYAYSAGPIRH